MASDYNKIRDDNIREYGEGTRHLAFLGRLYTDRTHFIYELLQNAEDAGATAVEFMLYPDRLEARHDGRLFDEKDVRGVCGVGEGTKAEDLTKIGKFGIGFKSVYAYTTLPQIHSGDEHFYIEHYVRPYAAPPIEPGAHWTTLFVFPFDRAEAPAKQAFREVAQRLERLSPRTLLFLRVIKEIEWCVAGGAQGLYLREVNRRGAATQVTVLAESGDLTVDEDWLVFERSVALPETAQQTRVEVAFLLERDEKSGRELVRRAKPSQLVVFFPTEKETRLGFLMQGPYRTTPARDNIPEGDATNKRLVEETAALLAESLQDLKRMGLVSISLLETLPIRAEDFPEDSLFRPIYDCVRDTLREKPLLPALDGGYVAGQFAKMGRSSALRSLLSETQLGQLYDTIVLQRWLSDEITQDRTPELWRYIRDELKVDDVTPEAFARRLKDSFLEGQTDEWMTQFYAFLYDQEALWGARYRSRDTLIDGAPLRGKRYLRLEDGRHVATASPDDAPTAYLPPPEPTDLPIIKRSLIAHPQALAFLRDKLKLTEPDTVEEVLGKVLPRYQAGATPTEAEYEVDIQKVVRALQTDSLEKRLRLIKQLKGTAILWAMNAGTGQRALKSPSEAYLRNPETESFFAGNPGAWLLDERYQAQARLWQEVGVRTRPLLEVQAPGTDGHVRLREWHSDHRRGLDGFDPQAWVDGLDYALQHITWDRAVYVWNALLVGHSQLIRGTIETSRRQSFEKAQSAEQESRLGHLVRSSLWLPDGQGQFHRPADLSLDDLPPVFERDEALAEALGMRLPEVKVLAEKLGVDLALIQLLHEYPDEGEKLKRRLARRQQEQAGLVEMDGHESGGELLDYTAALVEALQQPSSASPNDSPPSVGGVTNPTRRRELTREEIALAQANEPPPHARYTLTERRVWEAKDESVRVFLREQYQGACQVCAHTNSFVQRNGEPYFEAVYLVSPTEARWIDRPGNVVCLCAACAAKWLYGAHEAEDIVGQVQAQRLWAEGGQQRLVLRLQLCGQEVEVRYSERHMLDLQALLS